MLSETARVEIRKLMARYPDPRSALGPALHVVQRELGWIPPEAQKEVAALFGMDPTEVYAFVGFYNMYYKEPKGVYHLEVCTNISCKLRGADACARHLMQALGLNGWSETTRDGLFTVDHVECLGSCGTAPVMSVRKRGQDLPRYYEALTPERLDQVLAELRANVDQPLPVEPHPMGPAHFGGMEPKVLLARVAKPNSHRLETYVADGGYQALRKALFEMTPDQVIEEVKASGLRGRGGAGFPAGVKWSFLPKGVFPRYLVCNADESEPGTFKDRILMEYDPHQVLEGIILTAYAIQAEKAFIYIRGEYGFPYARLRQAIDEAYQHGYLGHNILGSSFSLDVILHRGAGAYICGEETALLTSLEGQRGHPRLKPPFPATEGLYRKPTIVNNVETLANVPHIIRNGAQWYRSFGTDKSPGFRLFAVSGEVRKPGIYELPHGVTLRELIYTHAGGTLDDRPVKAVIPGGLSMPLLTAAQLDTPLDFESVQAAGSLLGSAGVIVICEGTSLVEVMERTIAFYREESCGKCTPCREGTGWLEKVLHRIHCGRGRLEDLDEILRVSKFIEQQSFCPFGPAAVWGIRSAINQFRPELEAYIRQTNPAGEVPPLPVRPVYRPDVGMPAHERD
ncbi:MAG: NADH-quinone oxidoreductase subunit NuoF [Anaerolineae bacterium]|nr:NADH-quinone oxidoreductase subunit NuoF [Anaerolineae bacterium]MDW8100641.1 NADH-quinone oxidoreductase subunit NuoF [Anaerolineae bacterium]